MDGISSQLHRFVTEAPPAEVWAALTRPELTARYLSGLAAESGWQAGDAVAFAGGGATLSGDVLAAEAPCRLSYTLRSGDGQPETYVTWEVERRDAGSLVRLSVDEPGEPAVDAETEGAWLEVVARLQAALAASRRREGLSPA